MSIHRLTSLFILSEQNLLAYAKKRLNQSTQLLDVFEGHETAVTSIYFNQNSQEAFFSSGENNSILKWDIRTKTPMAMGLNMFNLHKLNIESIDLSADGNYLLSGSWDKTIKLWDTRTGECLWTSPKHKGWIRDVALRTENQQALSGGQRDLKLWDIATGNCLQDFSCDFDEKYLNLKYVRAVCLSQTGNWILSGNAQGQIKLWNSSTGNCLQVIEAHNFDIWSLSLSNDETLVLSTGQDKTIKLWQVVLIDNQPSLIYLNIFEGHSGFVFSACLSNNNESIISASQDGTIKIWEVETGRCLRTLVKHTGAVQSVCLNGDNSLLLSGGKDKTIKLWSLGFSTNSYKASVKLSRSNYIDNDLESSQVFAQEYSQAKTALKANNYSLALRHIRKALNQPNFSENKDALIILGNLYNFLHRKSLQRQILFNSWTYDSSQVIMPVLDNEENIPNLLNFEAGSALTSKASIAGYNLKTSAQLSLDGNQLLFSRICSNSRNLKILTIPNFDCPPDNVLGIEANLQNIANDDIYIQLMNEANEEDSKSLATRAYKAWIRIKFIYRYFMSMFEFYALPISRPVTSFNREKNFVLSANNRELLGWNLENKKHFKITNFSGISYLLSKLISNVISFVSEILRILVKMTVINGGLLKIVTYPIFIILSPLLGLIHLISDIIFSNVVTALYFSENKQYAIVGYYINNFLKKADVRIWDIEKSKCKTFSSKNSHTDTVNSVYLSKNNDLVVSGSDDGTVKLWSVAVGNCLNTFSEHTGKVLSVCMSSDNRFILSSSSESDKNLILRDLDKGTQVFAFTILLLIKNGFYELPLLMVNNDRTFIQNTSKYTFLNGHDGAVNSVCMSIDSRVALSGGSDKTVKLWDVETGECLSTFEGHTGEVTSVALSGDCRWAVSVAGDEVKLWFLDWELEDGELIDWDEGARPYLDSFLQRHRLLTSNSYQNYASLYVWNEQDFQYLIEDLGFVGYGWLRPEGVRRQLENMVGLNFEDHQFLNDTKDIDYTYLRFLLAGKDWKSANEETWKLILKGAQREKEGYIKDVEMWKNVPYKLIYIIDRLWIEYSNGKFGFSVQKSIFYQLFEFSNEPSQNFQFEDWKIIGDYLGWRKENQWLSYNDLTFDDVHGNRGHLPLLGGDVIPSFWTRLYSRYYDFISSSAWRQL